MRAPSDVRTLQAGVRRFLAGEIDRDLLARAFPDWTRDEVDLVIVLELLGQDSRPAPPEDRVLH